MSSPTPAPTPPATPAPAGARGRKPSVFGRLIGVALIVTILCYALLWGNQLRAEYQASTMTAGIAVVTEDAQNAVEEHADGVAKQLDSDKSYYRADGTIDPDAYAKSRLPKADEVAKMRETALKAIDHASGKGKPEEPKRVWKLEAGIEHDAQTLPIRGWQPIGPVIHEIYRIRTSDSTTIVLPGSPWLGIPAIESTADGINISSRYIGLHYSRDLTLVMQDQIKRMGLEAHSFEWQSNPCDEHGCTANLYDRSTSKTVPLENTGRLNEIVGRICRPNDCGPTQPIGSYAWACEGEGNKGGQIEASYNNRRLIGGSDMGWVAFHYSGGWDMHVEAVGEQDADYKDAVAACTGQKADTIVERHQVMVTRVLN